jgi:PHD/YefM family antitoxin component YafN of YafNO toxin-antitoxin module
MSPLAVNSPPFVIPLSVDDVESLEETIAILADANRLSSLLASEAEIARGETVSQEELDAAMAARRRLAP